MRVSEDHQSASPRSFPQEFLFLEGVFIAATCLFGGLAFVLFFPQWGKSLPIWYGEYEWKSRTNSPLRIFCWKTQVQKKTPKQQTWLLFFFMRKFQRFFLLNKRCCLNSTLLLTEGFSGFQLLPGCPGPTFPSVLDSMEEECFCSPCNWEFDSELR